MPEERYQRIDLANIEPNPWQPRAGFPQEKLAEMAASIKENGVIQPALARKVGSKFQLATGGMRLAASSLVRVADLPCVVRDLTDKQMKLYAFVENLHRSDLKDREKEDGLYKLWESEYRDGETVRGSGHGRFPGVTQMAHDIGISQQMASDYLDAYMARHELTGSREVPAPTRRQLERLSSADMREIAPLVREAPQAAQVVIQARATDVIPARQVRQVVQAARQAPAEHRVEAAQEIVRAHQQAQEHVELVRREVEENQGQPTRTVVRRQTSADQTRVERLINVQRDLQMYATSSYVRDIEDKRLKEKAVSILEAMVEMLQAQLRQLRR